MKPRELSSGLVEQVIDHKAVRIRENSWVCIRCQIRWPCLDVQLAIIKEIVDRETEKPE